MQRPGGAEARSVARASAFGAKAAWLCGRPKKDNRIHPESRSPFVTRQRKEEDSTTDNISSVTKSEKACELNL